MLGINLYREILFFLDYDDVYRNKLYITSKQFKQLTLQEHYVLHNCLWDSFNLTNEILGNSVEECLMFLQKIKQEPTLLAALFIKSNGGFYGGSLSYGPMNVFAMSSAHSNNYCSADSSLFTSLVYVTGKFLNQNSTEI